MAPSGINYYDQYTTTISHRWIQPYIYQPKKETKKERVQRIAKAKMRSSWKSYNQKNERIIQVKQICKPKHITNHIVR